MFTNLLLFLVVNLFWLTFPLIGYAIIRFCSTSKLLPSSIQLLSQSLLKRHIFIQFFVSTVISFGSISFLVFGLYAIRAPILVLVISYLIAVSVSSVYIVRYLSTTLFKIRGIDPLRIGGHLNIVKYVSIALLFLVAIDFCVSIFLGGHAASGSDTYYHITRITSMLSDGAFTIKSGFFEGVPDASYQANLIYALYTIPSYLFHTHPLDVWNYSFGFFRLIQWSSIFTLSFVIARWWLDSRRALYWANLATILAILFFSAYFYIASYPNQIVSVWIIAYILTLLFFIRYSKIVYFGALCVISFLITTTHPTYGLMTALLTMYWYCLYGMVYGRKSPRIYIKNSLKIIIIVIILMIGPVISKSMPSHITVDQQTVTAASVVNLPFGMSILSLETLVPQDKLQLLTLILSIIGIVYAIIRVRGKKEAEMSLLFAMVTFPAVLLYFPPVFTALKMLLPVWIIQRSGSMDILQFILPFAGVVAIALSLVGIGCMTRIVKRGQKGNAEYLTLAVAVFLAGCLPGLWSYKQLIASKVANPEAYSYANTLEDGLLAASLKLDGATILADDRISYTLPAIVGVNVIALEAGHSTTAADTKHRILCKEELLKNFQFNDMAYDHIDYVVISKFDDNIDNINRIVATKPYLVPVAKIADLTFYKFTRQPMYVEKGNLEEEVFSACRQYLKIESE